jgi:hypothetical protein
MKEKKYFSSSRRRKICYWYGAVFHPPRPKYYLVLPKLGLTEQSIIRELAELKKKQFVGNLHAFTI